MSLSNSVAVLAAVIGVTTAAAVDGAPSRGQEMADYAVKQQATTLAAFPALAKVDRVIRSDCETKNKGRIAGGDFCGCAAAVTMLLWMSGADPKMIPRLNEYLKNPTDAAASGFLKFQGPELYAGICGDAFRS